MPLSIVLMCPICGMDVKWVYDTEKHELHRGALGCPGRGCTAIQQIRVYEITEEKAEKLVNQQRFMI